MIWCSLCTHRWHVWATRRFGRNISLVNSAPLLPKRSDNHAHCIVHTRTPCHYKHDSSRKNWIKVQSSWRSSRTVNTRLCSGHANACRWQRKIPTGRNIIVIIYLPSPFTSTYPLTLRVVGSPQTTSQSVSSILLCSPLPSGTWRTSGPSIPWCCLATFYIFVYLKKKKRRWGMNGRTPPYLCVVFIVPMVMSKQRRFRLCQWWS